MRLLLIALLTSCAAESAETHYQCDLIRSCGQIGYVVRVDWYGDGDDVQETADEWSSACQVLTAPEVSDRSCSSVLCGVICELVTP